LSLYVAVATKATAAPPMLVVFAPGATVTEERVAAVTVMVAVPVVVPDVAVIVAVPTFTPVTTPLALTVATVASLEVHVAVAVTSCVVKLLKMPVAVRGVVPVTVTLAVPGVTVIELSTAAVTVRLAVPDFGEPAPVLTVAVRVTGPPAFTAVARPAATVAIVASLVVQVAVAVTSAVVLSL